MRIALVVAALGCCGMLVAAPADEGGAPEEDAVTTEDYSEMVFGLYEVLMLPPEVECLREKPSGFLVNADHLLGAGERGERLRFLEYHSGDSKIDLYAFVFRSGDEMPVASQVEEFADHHFAEGKPVALVMYPLGDPARAELFLGPGLRGLVSAQELRRALASAVQQSQEEVDSASQLEAFLLQVSMRLYWMERALGEETRRPTEEAPVKELVEGKKASKDGPQRSLATLLPALETLEPWAGRIRLVSALSLCGCLALFIARLRMKNEFPDFSVEPRLGGAHAAGVGAVISFSSASKSPASQRDPGKDFLGRL